MDKKEMFENNIVSEIKNLIISDSELTYGERNSFNRFIIRIQQGERFETAVKPLLKNLQRLENKEIQSDGLTDEAKKIYEQLQGKYELSISNSDYSVFTGTGAGRKLTNRELLEITIFLIVAILAYFLYHIYLE